VKKRATRAKKGARPDPDLLLERDVASLEREILPLADAALLAAHEAGFTGERGEPRLKLALIELITNAMEHGNLFDATRRVRLRVRRATKDRLEVTIADEGPGPSPERLERDLDDVALESKRGRGLGLVKRILGAPATAGERPGEVVIAFERGRFS